MAVFSMFLTEGWGGGGGGGGEGVYKNTDLISLLKTLEHT